MDFIADTIALLPQPAALFDDRLHLVAANERAWMWYVEQVPDDIQDRETLREVTGLGEVLALAHAGGHARRESPWGWVVGTKVETEIALTRPTLVLVTLHAAEARLAELDHRRMLLTLQVNETSDITMRAMRQSLLQIQAALSAQERLVDTFNAEMAHFLDNYDDQEKKSQTGLDRT